MRVGRGAESTPGQLVFRAQLFVSAYSLLFFLFAIRYPVPWVQITFYTLGALGFLAAVRLVFRHSRVANVYSYRIESVEDAGAMVHGFLASHLLPFLAPGSPTTRDTISYAIFFAVLMLVSVNSDLAHVNPTLYLLNRRVVRVTVGGESRILVCSRTPRTGDEVRAVRATGGLIETREGSLREWLSSLAGRTCGSPKKRR